MIFILPRTPRDPATNLWRVKQNERISHSNVKLDEKSQQPRDTQQGKKGNSAFKASPENAKILFRPTGKENNSSSQQ